MVKNMVHNKKYGSMDLLLELLLELLQELLLVLLLLLLLYVFITQLCRWRFAPPHLKEN